MAARRKASDAIPEAAEGHGPEAVTESQGRAGSGGRVRMFGPLDVESVGVEGAVYPVKGGVVEVDPAHADAVSRAGFRLEVFE